MMAIYIFVVNIFIHNTVFYNKPQFQLLPISKRLIPCNIKVSNNLKITISLVYTQGNKHSEFSRRRSQTSIIQFMALQSIIYEFFLGETQLNRPKWRKQNVTLCFSIYMYVVTILNSKQNEFSL